MQVVRLTTQLFSLKRVKIMATRLSCRSLPEPLVSGHLREENSTTPDNRKGVLITDVPKDAMNPKRITGKQQTLLLLSTDCNGTSDKGPSKIGTTSLQRTLVSIPC